MPRPARKITEAEKKELLELKPDDLTFTKLVYLFGDTTDAQNAFSGVKKSKFSTWDEMTLDPSEYFVKEKTKTTVGRFIFNKYLIERFGFQSVLGYVNEPVTQGKYESIESQLAKALIDDKISINDFYDYYDYRDTLGMQLNSVITTSFSEKTIACPPEIAKRKEELFKKYDDKLNEGDIVTSEKIEKELTSEAKKLLADDPGMDLYNSGARGNFGNYKNMMLYKGATMNNITGEYEIVRSSFMDGITKQDIPSFGTSVVSGAYPKAVGTAESGYLTKQLLAAMQGEVLDEHGSDCGTKKTISYIMTPKDTRDFEYRYIVENGKYVCLIPEIIGKYVGKPIKLRSPMYCKGKHICNICAGELNYKLDNLNIGLGCPQISTKLLKMGMKKFHTANIKSNQIDPDTMLL